MLLVDAGHVMNSTTNEGTNTRCNFGDDNISTVGRMDPPVDVATEKEVPVLVESSVRDESAATEEPAARDVSATVGANSDGSKKSGVTKASAKHGASIRVEKSTSHETTRINVTVISNTARRIIQKMHCNGCNRTFGNTSALTRHTPFCKNTSSENILSEVSLRYECAQCGKTFSSKGYLKQHQNNSKYCKRVQEEELALALSETNSSTKSLKCNGCNKEFAQRTTYASHKNMCQSLNLGSDTGLSNSSIDDTIPLHCSLCRQVFKSKSGLTRHTKFCLLKEKSQLSETSAYRNNTSPDEHQPQQSDTSHPQQSNTSHPQVQPDNSPAHQPDTSPARQPDTSPAQQPDTSLSKQPDTSVSQQVATSCSQPANKSNPEQIDMSLTMQQPTNDLKCTFCPRVCTNKGSLASHKKACEVRNNPGQLKTRCRLSKSLNFALRHPEDRDRRLSTTLLVKEVKYWK